MQAQQSPFAPQQTYLTAQTTTFNMSDMLNMMMMMMFMVMMIKVMGSAMAGFGGTAK